VVPIHPTDLAENRWKSAEWEHYELWEKLEKRVQRKRRIWIAATLVVFLAISAIPVVKDRWLKWSALKVARLLSQQINQMKRDAMVARTPHRLILVDDLGVRIEPVADCAGIASLSANSAAVPTVSVRQVDFGFSELKWLEPADGERWGVPGLVREYCFDPLKGGGSAAKGLPVIGLGVAPKADLTEGRSDRMAVIFVSGPSAEVAYE
jgi:hypothetical protein